MTGLLTAPGQGIRDVTTTPLGLSCLIATPGRLSRLTTAPEDLAQYCGPASLSQSRSRICEPLIEPERRAEASYRLLAGLTAEPSPGGQRPLWPG